MMSLALFAACGVNVNVDPLATTGQCSCQRPCRIVCGTHGHLLPSLGIAESINDHYLGRRSLLAPPWQLLTIAMPNQAHMCFTIPFTTVGGFRRWSSHSTMISQRPTLDCMVINHSWRPTLDHMMIDHDHIQDILMIVLNIISY